MPKKRPTPKAKTRRAAPAESPPALDARQADAAAAGEHTSFEAWEASLNPVEKVVDSIVEFMANGQWLGGVSDREVGKKFGLSPETVRRYAAEANRVLRRRLRDDPELAEDARYEILQTFRIIRALGVQNKDAGSLGVALNATRALGFYLGVEPARRVDVADVSKDEQDDWSDAELDAFAKSGKRPRRALGYIAGVMQKAAEDADDDDDGTDEPKH